MLIAVAVSYCAPVSGALAEKLTSEWVEKMARPLVEKHVVDGLSVGFIEGEKFGIVHLGSANAAGDKADMMTVYELGSVSKVFTSLLLADAVVRGEIDLKAAAEVANPAGIRFPAREGRAITWLDLSTHRTGLPRLAGNFVITNPADPYREYDSKKAAEFLQGYQLPRKPGEAQEYSNFAVSVLGYLLATKAGKSYDQLLKERIAEPLKMTDCTVSLNEEQTKRLATPHSMYGVVTPPWTFADMPGAGGVRATMRDMMRFAKAQLDPPSGKLGEAIELAWKQQTAADSSGSAMGLGWMIAGDGQTRWHNGQVGGSHSAVFINRGLKCAVVVLCNTAVRNEIDQLATQVLLKAAGQDIEPEPTVTADNDTKKLPIDAKLRGRLAGRYQLTPNFIFTVTDEDGHLMVGITNQATQEVFPDSPTLWSYHGIDAKLEFKLPKTGAATSLVLVQNGARQMARRMKGAAGEVKPAASDKSAEKLPIDANLRGRLVGRYQLAPDFIFDVQDRDGHLMVGITNQATQEVFADSPTRWSYRGVKATLEFKLPKSGAAKSLVLHQNGVQQVARRIE
jgi:CubicO group peptidase (beta-lactamase class C family)